jgi:hypothetical protein
MQPYVFEWITRIMGSLISWPSVCLVALLILRRPLQKLLGGLITFKWGRVELQRQRPSTSAKRRKPQHLRSAPP